MIKRLLELQDLLQKWGKWLTKPEENEQIRFILWLEERGYDYFAIPNSTWTKSRVQQVRNTLMGVVPGPPDMVIVLKRQSLLFLEFKRPRKILKDGSFGVSPSKVSEEQKKWLKTLASIHNVEAMLAYGFEHAKEIVHEQESL